MIEENKTILGKTFKINGDIDYDGELEVHGSINGNIKCNSVRIYDTGKVVGKVISDQVLVDGQVDGGVTARNLQFRANGYIEGEIEYVDMNMAEGATLHGSCKKVKPDALPASIVQGVKVG